MLFLFTKDLASLRITVPKDDVGSYRPVSVTSVLGKVLEKLISVRMMDYINENNILSDDQFGFRRGRNCEQMLSIFLMFSASRWIIVIFNSIQFNSILSKKTLIMARRPNCQRLEQYKKY